MKAHAIAVAALFAGCATQADSVCEDIGYCTTQSDDQISACKQNARLLSQESAQSGCASQYTSYFSCADDSYACDGNKPLFPGCDGALAALDSCLAAGRAQNACGELQAKLAACSAGSPLPSSPPDACGATDVCAARCYLDDVSDPCRATLVELANFTNCSKLCPI